MDLDTQRNLKQNFLVCLWYEWPSVLAMCLFCVYTCCACTVCKLCVYVCACGKLCVNVCVCTRNCMHMFGVSAHLAVDICVSDMCNRTFTKHNRSEQVVQVRAAAP